MGETGGRFAGVGLVDSRQGFTDQTLTGGWQAHASKRRTVTTPSLRDDACLAMRAPALKHQPCYCTKSEVRVDELSAWDQLSGERQA